MRPRKNGARAVELTIKTVRVTPRRAWRGGPFHRTRFNLIQGCRDGYEVSRELVTWIKKDRRHLEGHRCGDTYGTGHESDIESDGPAAYKTKSVLSESRVLRLVQAAV